jgi:hypothetical protein
MLHRDVIQKRVQFHCLVGGGGVFVLSREVSKYIGVDLGIHITLI